LFSIIDTLGEKLELLAEKQFLVDKNDIFKTFVANNGYTLFHWILKSSILRDFGGESGSLRDHN
jgi:hypothetical protein